MDEPERHPLTHPCPQCGQLVEIPAIPTGAPLRCPSCGEQFFIDVEEPADESIEATQEDRLDSMKIERMVKIRRSTYRSRSHAIIAALVCVVAAIQVIVGIVRQSQIEWNAWIALYFAVALAAIYGSIFFARRALAINREL